MSPAFTSASRRQASFGPAAAILAEDADGNVLKDLPCGRNLNECQAVLYIHVGGYAAIPKMYPCEIVDQSGGIVRAAVPAGDLPVGMWPWTLFVVTNSIPVPVYAGNLTITERPQP